MLEDLVDGVSESLGLGVGLVAVAAAVLVGGRLMKPLAKGAIKGYLTVTHGMREAVAGASESVQDLYAEAKHEYESQGRGEEAAEAETEARPTRARRSRVQTEEEEHA
jgi:hypothetical protein